MRGLCVNKMTGLALQSARESHPLPTSSTPLASISVTWASFLHSFSAVCSALRLTWSFPIQARINSQLGHALCSFFPSQGSRLRGFLLSSASWLRAVYPPFLKPIPPLTTAYCARVSWSYGVDRNETCSSGAGKRFRDTPHLALQVNAPRHPTRKLQFPQAVCRGSHKPGVGLSECPWQQHRRLVLRNDQRKVFKVCWFPPITSHSHSSDSTNTTHREDSVGQFSKGTQGKYNFARK